MGGGRTRQKRVLLIQYKIDTRNFSFVYEEYPKTLRRMSSRYRFRIFLCEADNLLDLSSRLRDMKPMLFSQETIRMDLAGGSVDHFPFYHTRSKKNASPSTNTYPLGEKKTDAFRKIHVYQIHDHHRHYVLRQTRNLNLPLIGTSFLSISREGVCCMAINIKIIPSFVG